MNARRWMPILGVHALCFFPASCDPFVVEQIHVPTLDDVSVKDYSIQLLAPAQQPYGSSQLASPILPGDSTDADGIPMFSFQGSKYYHPVHIAQRVLLLLNTFRLTGDSLFIDESRKLLDKLLEMGERRRDALYFPYRFSIHPHGGSGTDNTQLLEAPWFSGMAQGQVLSALVRLYRITSDSTYLHAADLVFHSYQELKADGHPWTVYIDRNKYYWIEEYPLDAPSNVLNGFIYSVFGLYDYYWLDPGDEARSHLLKAALRTIEENVLRYRRPGERSYYCLKHEYVATEDYHRLHVRLLNQLYLITGEAFFKDVAILFAEDA